MKRLSIVLVRPKYPRNIGLVARILANYNLSRLILVNPQCELNEEARQGAAQGQSPLRTATCYSSWEEFYLNEADGIRVAFSRRQGKRRASLPLQQVLNLELLQEQRPIYFFFGAEDHGMNAEDLQNMHRLAYFDLPGELQSMNLSHSVLVAVESYYRVFGNKNFTAQHTEIGLQDPEPFLRQWLEALHFDLESQTRWNALTMLKQLLLKAAPTREELHKLNMIIQQTIRKIAEK